MNEGCTCTNDQLMHFLRIMGCDQTDGRFHVDGTIVSFLGLGEDYVIGADAVYYVNGMARPLAAHYVGVTGRGKCIVI